MHNHIFKISFLGLFFSLLITNDKPTPKPFNSYVSDEYTPAGPNDHRPGKSVITGAGGQFTTEELMAEESLGRNISLDVRFAPLIRNSARKNLPQQGNAQEEVDFEAHDEAIFKSTRKYRNPQKISSNFIGGTYSTSFPLFPPDSMGAVGPTQYIVCINSIIRSFNKKTGLRDNVLNISPDTFFDSVRDNAFSSDPRIRYDHFSDRWFITMINVPDSFNANRIMIAVSDSGIITNSTIWNFFYFAVDDQTFFDYPTLGIDRWALYIGGATFSNNDTGKVFVVQKSSILGSGPMVVTEFDNIINPTTFEGPYAPQGVDNFDSHPTFGYFIGVNNAAFGSLVLLRVANPASTSPTISGNIFITTAATTFPILVKHKGNTKGESGNLSPVDDRLMCAHIRKGHLWTTHTIGINNKGISSGTITRNGSRWYEIDVNPTTPIIKQSGILYAATTNNDSNQRSYWMPSIMTTGQGHMALGCTVAGAQEFINVAASGRLATDPTNTLQAPTIYTNNKSAYNPPLDTGDPDFGRRWGDYSYISVDPSDNMTMWSIQEYCGTTNVWAVRVAKLLAPPPATPLKISPGSVSHGLSSVDIILTGKQVAGSGFYDPGSGFTNRLHATMNGGIVVNTVTYVNSTKIKLNISTVAATIGKKNITITNPDGQSITGSGLLTIT